jgi:predicted molibdopterin-dependent oxidoreductase YjgC
MAPPGDAREDWQILVDVAAELNAGFTWRDPSAIRGALAHALSGTPAYAVLADVGFSRPVAARTWLESSNPSERWKWDHVFRDLPPVKAL